MLAIIEALSFFIVLALLALLALQFNRHRAMMLRQAETEAALLDHLVDRVNRLELTVRPARGPARVVAEEQDDAFRELNLRDDATEAFIEKMARRNANRD